MPVSYKVKHIFIAEYWTPTYLPPPQKNENMCHLKRYIYKCLLPFFHNIQRKQPKCPSTGLKKQIGFPYNGHTQSQKGINY